MIPHNWFYKPETTQKALTLSYDQLSKNNSFYSLGAMAESLYKQRKKKIKIPLYTILAQNLCCLCHYVSNCIH